ncbi:MAG: hypothetical protein ACI82A_002810 [Candidatus Azotimanducaceae bacterium]|jgi:hypothetical protein
MGPQEPYTTNRGYHRSDQQNRYCHCHDHKVKYDRVNYTDSDKLRNEQANHGHPDPDIRYAHRRPSRRKADFLIEEFTRDYR